MEVLGHCPLPKSLQDLAERNSTDRSLAKISDFCRFTLQKLRYDSKAKFADVAELVDALDLGSSTARCEGSSPFVRILSQIVERNPSPSKRSRLQLTYCVVFIESGWECYRMSVGSASKH